MSRPLVCGLTLILLASLAPAQATAPRGEAGNAAAAAGGDDGAAPERLLSPTTQFYVRWDGIGAHKAAYQASVWGSITAGPTGESIRAMLDKVPKLLGANLLAEPLLDGKPPEDLRAIHADLKNANKLVELVADRGVLVAAEVREPRPTLRGIGKAVGGLISGKPAAGAADLLVPEAQVVVIIPDVGDRAETIFAAVRLLTRQSGEAVEKLPADLGRTGFTLREAGSPVRVAWWAEGPHFVFAVGTVPVETAVRAMKSNAAQGGLTGHPLFQRCHQTAKAAGFEAVARGYVDTQSVVGLAKRLAGPFVPGLTERVDGLGLGNLQAVVFTSGFDGKESRALYEFDLPGERKGLAKVLKPVPMTLAELPPLPADVSRFSSLRIDPAAVYDAGLSAIELLSFKEDFGVEDGAKDQTEVIRRRTEYLNRELTKALGVSVRDDLLPYLGDKVVLYQGPTEGLNVFGAVFCVSCKDAAKVKAAIDRMGRGVETIVGGGQMKVRKKIYRGVEMREVYTRGFGVLTPTYAVVGDWLVIAGHPQPVQGFILRSKGELPKWKPDAGTAARLAKLPADAVGIQYCDPRSTVQNICCIGPLVLSAITRLGGNNSQGDFDPIDIGLIPNGLELSNHLFPNLTVTRDDGRTVRIDVNESFSLPGEFVGFEPAAFAIITFAARF